jgi:hypothetical protein
MRNPSEKVELRLDAAKAAAPYMHRRMPVGENGDGCDDHVLFDAVAVTRLTNKERNMLLALLEKMTLRC